MIRDEIREQIARDIYFEGVDYEDGSIASVCWDEIRLQRKEIFLKRADRILAIPQISQLLELLEEKEKLEKRDGKQYQLAIVDEKAELPKTYFAGRKKMPWITDYDVEVCAQQDMLKDGFKKVIRERI